MILVPDSFGGTNMLDSYDRRILGLLQRDGDLSVNAISDEIGLSATPCWRRIKKLEEAGYMQKRVVLLNPEKLNVGVSVFIAIRTNQHSREWAQKFLAAVKSIPEIVDIHRLSGDVDYLVRAVVPDIATYDRIYQKLIERVDLYDVSSMFSMEALKTTTELPLNYA